MAHGKTGTRPFGSDAPAQQIMFCHICCHMIDTRHLVLRTSFTIRTKSQLPLVAWPDHQRADAKSKIGLISSGEGLDVLPRLFMISTNR